MVNKLDSMVVKEAFIFFMSLVFKCNMTNGD
jgi:hypothetical protein